MSVLCVLPARISSQRLPRKPLRSVAGRPLIEWSWRAASRVPSFDDVWVATDDREILEAVEGFGGTAVLTDPDHPSGTDRVAEAAGRPEARSHDVVVNYQADEPFLDPEAVDRVTRQVVEGGTEVATLAAPLASLEQWRSAAVVKVVRDRSGVALYFSRAPVPHPRDGEPELPPPASREPGEEEAPAAPAFLRHVGLYAFSRGGLERWTGLEPSGLERIERLEQLRALEAGMSIRVLVGPPTEPGVDEPADLRRAERVLKQGESHQPDEANV